MLASATLSPPLPSLLPEHWLSGPREQEGEEEVKKEGRFLVLHLENLLVRTGGVEFGNLCSLDTFTGLLS